MRYLIDGHNLIAHLPDINLEDPHDEVKLVYKLRGFSARTGKKITVVFDGGIPGGVSKSLSTTRISVKFASSNRSTADQILKNTLRSTKNPHDVILVTSDNEISAVASSRKIKTLAAREFIQLLRPPDDMLTSEKEDNPTLSAGEVETWLQIFSDAANDSEN